MGDVATERMIELQKHLTIRLAELGFEGQAATNVVHRLAEIAVLANGVATTSLPLLLEVSLDHRDALISVVTHIKLDLDEIRDGITDLETDLSALLEFLHRR